MGTQKTFRFTIITGLILISLCSCDPYGGYHYWIDNKSDSTLFVVYHNLSSDSIVKISVDKNEARLIDEFSTINGLQDDGDEFLRRFDSLGIFLDTIQITEIKKNYLTRQAWTYKAEATGMFGKAGDNIYRLEIGNEDLE